MSDDSWTDQIVGERMTVDQEFSPRITDSRFSNQEWSLIMTATEFEIEQPESPESARLVANTDSVESVLPELENVRSQVGAMGGAEPDRGGSNSDGGFLGAIKETFGLGGGDSDGDEYADEREAAERLTQKYADALQAELEANGRWESVCEAAAES